MRAVIGTTIAAMSLMMLTAAPARADADDIARQQADISFKEGLRLFNQGDYQRAWLEFTKANAIYPRGSLLRNLGLCELKMNKPLDALKHFRAAGAAPDTKPDQRALADEDVATVYAQTGHIAVRASEGATLAVDGRDVGAVPKDPVDVLPGHHVVEAHVGTRSARVEVDAAAGVIVSADVHVEEPAQQSAAPSPAAAAPAKIDDRPTVRDLAMPPSEPARSFWTTRREVGVGVAAAGVIALGLGIYFDTQASAAESQATSSGARLGPSACSGPSQPAACGDVASAYASQSTDVTWSRVFYGAAAVGLVAGAALILWPSSSSSRTTTVAIVPLVSPSGGGLQIHGEL